MCRCKCVWWMVLEWNVFEDVVCSTDFNLYSSRHQEGLCLYVYGGMVLCMQYMPNYLRARWYTQNRQSIKAVTRAAFRTS